VGEPKNYQKLKDKVFAGDEGLLKQWIHWNTDIGNKGQGFTRYRQDMKVHATRRADFDEWWKSLSLSGDTSTLPPAVSTAVLDWLDRDHVLPGKRFTGAYSKKQLKLFKAIHDAWANKQIINAATKNSFGTKYELNASGQKVKQNKEEGAGKSGESGRAGIYAKHWYGVVSVEITENNIRYVTVRNPHGETGRAYQNNKAVRVDGAAGVESRLELCDFTKLFEQIQVNGRALA